MICRTDKSVRLWTCLLAINLLFIWGNSLLPGNISGAISGWVKDVIHALLPGGADDPEAGHGLLRKLGHFTEFTCLGVCLSMLTRMLREKTWEHLVMPLILGAAAAGIDETIQIFVPDRGPGLRDVGIDTLGVATGILLITLMVKIIRKQKKSAQQSEK